MRFLPFPRVRRLPDFNGFRVFLVDGEAVRNRLEVDFTMGGTFARWKFIPDGEIWIDQCLGKVDRQATIRHEAEEHFRMIHEGMTYEAAHEQANVVEREYRSGR